MKLYAPLTYWEATQDERDTVCNGCGAKGGADVNNFSLKISKL